MGNVASMTDSIYFAPLLPWQQDLWIQLTERVLTSSQSLPHALLAAGRSGLGKRAFIWRLIAWLLCFERREHPMGACGSCGSCQWLKSNTHPSLQVLPLASMPSGTESDFYNKTGNELASKTAKKSAVDTQSTKPPSKSGLTIKVDDIRALQPFIYQGGQGMRICVLDHAEQMTIAAANALLKTLEEPQAQVHLFLISDNPAQLLPTIKSRVQQLPLHSIATPIARDYVTSVLGGVTHALSNTVNHKVVSPSQIEQLLQLSNGAPLAAIDLAQAPWYSKRSLWLTTWQALRNGKRSAIAASDYWQSQLSIADFMTLTEMMLLEIRRIGLGLSGIQKDIDLVTILQDYRPNDNALETLVKNLQQLKIALQQNVQEKFAYDELMQQLAQL